MSVASEITRIQNAKASLKTSINAKTDAQHQITNEKIDDYADFVDSITTGGGGHDWSAIGYTGEPSYLVNAYNHAVEIYNAYESTTDWNQKYRDDENLFYFPYIDTSSVLDFNACFYNDYRLVSVPALDTRSATRLRNMFYVCYSLQHVDFTNFDTSNCTSMEGMFYRCYSLGNMVLDFDTDKVTTFESMFQDCWHIQELDLSSWTSTAVSTCAYMFSGCRTLSKLDMRNFDFTKLNTSSKRTQMFGTNASSGPPNNCLIIVKDSSQKSWFSTNFSRFTNVKTPSEL